MVKASTTLKVVERKVNDVQSDEAGADVKIGKEVVAESKIFHFIHKLRQKLKRKAAVVGRLVDGEARIVMDTRLSEKLVNLKGAVVRQISYADGVYTRAKGESSLIESAIHSLEESILQRAKLGAAEKHAASTVLSRDEKNELLRLFVLDVREAQFDRLEEHQQLELLKNVRHVEMLAQHLRTCLANQESHLNGMIDSIANSRHGFDNFKNHLHELSGELTEEKRLVMALEKASKGKPHEEQKIKRRQLANAEAGLVRANRSRRRMAIPAIAAIVLIIVAFGVFSPKSKLMAQETGENLDDFLTLPYTFDRFMELNDKRLQILVINEGGLPSLTYEELKQLDYDVQLAAFNKGLLNDYLTYGEFVELNDVKLQIAAINGDIFLVSFLSFPELKQLDGAVQLAAITRDDLFIEFLIPTDFVQLDDSLQLYAINEDLFTKSLIYDELIEFSDDVQVAMINEGLFTDSITSYDELNQLGDNAQVAAMDKNLLYDYLVSEEYEYLIFDGLAELSGAGQSGAIYDGTFTDSLTFNELNQLADEGQIAAIDNELFTDDVPREDYDQLAGVVQATVILNHLFAGSLTYDELIKFDDEVQVAAIYSDSFTAPLLPDQFIELEHSVVQLAMIDDKLFTAPLLPDQFIELEHSVVQLAMIDNEMFTTPLFPDQFIELEHSVVQLAMIDDKLFNWILIPDQFIELEHSVVQLAVIDDELLIYPLTPNQFMTLDSDVQIAAIDNGLFTDSLSDYEYNRLADPVKDIVKYNDLYAYN